MSNASPSVNPADEGTLTGAFKLVFRKMMQGIDGSIPAVVVAFDRDSNRVNLQPAIKILGTNKEQVSRGQVSSVPVFQIGGGGFGVFFNLKPGDRGWLVACDRDISIFLQSYAESSPQTERIKNFSDGFFLPDVMTDFTIDSEDSENLVIQKNDGSVKISLWDDKIKIVAPNVEIDSDVKITGNLSVIGDITATGDITPHVPP